MECRFLRVACRAKKSVALVGPVSEIVCSCVSDYCVLGCGFYLWPEDVGSGVRVPSDDFSGLRRGCELFGCFAFRV